MKWSRLKEIVNNIPEENLDDEVIVVSDNHDYLLDFRAEISSDPMYIKDGEWNFFVEEDKEFDWAKSFMDSCDQVLYPGTPYFICD